MATHDYPATSSGPDISGTPSAGNYARWSDADTLEARSAAQVLSDIGAPDITGTPAANQMATWADANTLQGVKRYYAHLSHATYSNGELITLPFAASGGAADGEYYARVVRRAVGGSTGTDQCVSFAISSDAVSGTPFVASNGPSTPGTVRIAVSGGYVCIHLANTSPADIYVEIFTNVTVASGTFSLSDVAPTGTSAGAQNLTASIYVVGNLYLSGAVRAILNPTSDVADNYGIQMFGGGAASSTRGGGISLYGNEHANTGEVVIEAGNVSGGDVDLKTADTSRIKFNHDGTLTIHATTLADLQSQIGAGETTGAVKMWGTGSAPTGYLLCDGSAVSRTTYSALFALIGTTFGAGDGSTTFALPDFRGRAPIGAGTGSGLTARTLAGTVGTETHTLTGAESGLPAHTHTIPGANGGSGSTRPGFADGGALYSHNTGSTGPTDASSAHNNMQPSLVVNFIIKT